MLYNMNWLQPGKHFPPEVEQDRIVRYHQNAHLFDGDHFDDAGFRSRVPSGISADVHINLYEQCARRISRVIGNFEDVISFPVLLNYQRLMTLKVADLVCGEHPTISGVTPKENAAIRDVRDASDFDAKLYETVIDISRYGDAIWRLYKDYDGRMNFTPWDPAQWYPIVIQDGTNSISAHCLCWIENRSKDKYRPDYYLNVQIHYTGADNENKPGYYVSEVYKLDADGSTIKKKVSSKKIPTGLKQCAVFHIRAFATTNSVYGYDDYMPLDSILAEIMTRVGQISAILDKHADPNITGPVSMLKMNEKTGEYELDTGKFFAISPGEEKPEYMTWDGQLTSAFKQLEFLINQMNILSEMGAALLGGQDGSSQAISGTAMRFKMVNPLAKVRRIANSLSRPVRQVFSVLSTSAEVDESEFESPESVPQAVDGENVPVQPKPEEAPLVLPIPYRKISVFWADGLPDDPRENIELCKLASGATKMMPLEKAIMEYFKRSNEEALQWIDQIHKESLANMEATASPAEDDEDPNKPGPQDGTGINPSKKGSKTGLKNFHGTNNK